MFTCKPSGFHCNKTNLQSSEAIWSFSMLCKKPHPVSKESDFRCWLLGWIKSLYPPVQVVNLCHLKRFSFCMERNFWLITNSRKIFLYWMSSWEDSKLVLNNVQKKQLTYVLCLYLSFSTDVFICITVVPDLDKDR